MSYRTNNFRTLATKIGNSAGISLRNIKYFEKKISDIDRGLNRVPSNLLWKSSPASILYHDIINLGVKPLLKTTEKTFTALGDPNRKKIEVAEGVLDYVNLVSGNTNDFIDRTLKNKTFKDLFNSPIVQNYLYN